VIAYPNQNPFVAGFGRDVEYRHTGVYRLAIATCIFQQVVNHPGKLHRIGEHQQALIQVQIDAHIGPVAIAEQTGIKHLRQRHRRQLHLVGTGVVEKLADDGVELCDVSGHVGSRFIVSHAEFGFQAQACQRCSQVV